MSKGTACRLASGMPLVLAGNMAYAAAQWLALVVLARWTTADAVGHYALALAVCGPVILFCNVPLAGSAEHRRQRRSSRSGSISACG